MTEQGFAFPTPGPEHERPLGELESWSLQNWLNVPADRRKACLDVLRVKTPYEFLFVWTDQIKRGMRPGSHDPFFHHSTGQDIRNVLRGVMTDDMLPEVRYPEGQMVRNWDDYYLGAIQELVESP